MPRGSRALFLACLLLLAATAPQARDRVARMVTEAEAPTYRAVGRLNVAGNRHCTATLIADNLVLTAAHCLFNPVTGRRAQPGDLRFVAGQRGETYAALRGVRAVAILPGYVFRRLPGGNDAATDVALLHLDAPIRPDEARPFAVGTWNRRSPVSLVAFGRDRAYIASIRENCRPERRSQELVVLDCPVVPGVSGAPVLLATPSGPVVVGVVSASRQGDGAAVAVLTPLLMIEALKALLLGDTV